MQHLEAVTKGDMTNGKAIVHFMTQNRYHDWFAERKVLHWFSCSSPQARLAYLHMFCETDVSAVVSGIDIPMLVICGDYDAPAHSAQRLQQTILQDFKNAKLACLPCGHYPMEEAPILLAATLERFWKNAELS
jgi:esterase